MNTTSLTGISACELGRMIRAGDLSPVELVAGVLERIHRLEGKINAFIRVLDESAMAQAEAAQKEIMRGEWRGPLHGVPIAIKDLIDVKGIPTTAGSKVWQDFIPSEDAPVVQKLKQAGAILVGKLNLHELAWGVTSNNPHYGPVHNPWDLSASCGGSSSGSAAALAAGYVPLTLGSDTGGSIRIPSSLTGVVGLKPSYGVVSCKGVLPLAWSMDHVGPMAVHVEDLALAMAVIADRSSGAGPEDCVERVLGTRKMEDGLKGIAVGVPVNSFFYEGLREDLKAAVLNGVKAMESLGARVEEIEVPGIVEGNRAAHAILFSEAAAAMEAHGRTRPHDLGDAVIANLRLGMTIPATRYIQAMRVRAKIIHELKKVFSKVDVVVVPGTMADAHTLSDAKVGVGGGASVDVRTAMTSYTRYFNLSGSPVLTIPCGLSGRGLPVGMQLVGRHFAEARLLAAGYVYRKAFPLDPLMPEIN